MTLSERAADVRARTHIEDPAKTPRPSSHNAQPRPPLRLVPGDTHIPPTPYKPISAHAASDHYKEFADELATHPVVANHPPTVADAAAHLWISAEDARHGLPVQVGAAGIGLIQLLGLALCWGAAHVLFGSKTRVAIFLLVLTASITAWAVASHR